MKGLSGILMKVLAEVLLTGGALKGWQLLTNLLVNNGIFSHIPSFIAIGHNTEAETQTRSRRRPEGLPSRQG
jgi:hypothetical protein